MSYHINSVEEMSAAALASGTHRIEITTEAGKFYAQLVEREEPDRDILYMPKARESGPAFICETPVSDFLGKSVELIGVFDPDSPFKFSLSVGFTDESGKYVQYPLVVKKEGK